MSQLLIRADAGGRLGTGHVMRTLALAQAWMDAGGAATFACAQCPEALARRLRAEECGVISLEAQPGSLEDATATAAIATGLKSPWIVVDGYQFGTAYQEALKKAGIRILFIDDYGHCDRYPGDIVLNQNAHAAESDYGGRSPGPKLLLGSPFALLRREFRRRRFWTRTVAKRGKNILVTLGGADPDNVTLKVLRAMENLPDRRISAKVLIGGANPNAEELERWVQGAESDVSLIRDASDLPELFAWADLAVTAGGSTVWEAAMMGLPSILIVIADNQADIAKSLHDAGVALSQGWHEAVTCESLSRELTSLLEDSTARARMSNLGRSLVDGLGALRVAAAIKGNLKIAIATDQDSWINDHLEDLVAGLRDHDHEVTMVHNANAIPGGDIAFFLSLGEVVPTRVLQRNTHNLVVHASSLPRGKGWSPLTWQILEGKNCIPVTLFEAQPALDSGSIYLQEDMEFVGTELVGELRAVLAKRTVELCQRFVDQYPFVAASARRQEGGESFYRRRTPEDSRLDPEQPLKTQFNLLRVVDNDRYPAFFDLGGKRYTIRISTD